MPTVAEAEQIAAARSYRDRLQGICNQQQIMLRTFTDSNLSLLGDMVDVQAELIDQFRRAVAQLAKEAVHFNPATGQFLPPKPREFGSVATATAVEEKA